MKAIVEFVLLLGVSTALLAEAGPLEDEAAQKVAKLDSKTVERLRHMFNDSQKLASQSLYEWIVLNQLKQKNEELQKHEGAIVGQSGEQTDSGKVIVHRDNQDGSSNGEYLISKQIKQVAGDNKALSGGRQAAENLPTELVVENLAPVAVHDDKNPNDNTKERNDARQTNLFSTFNHPPGGHLGTFPVGQGLFSISSPTLARLPAMPTMPTMPTLSTMPTLPIITPRPAKPAKSSVIGNNGGAMALTNDNVVVVNVLSNNY